MIYKKIAIEKELQHIYLCNLNSFAFMSTIKLQISIYKEEHEKNKNIIIMNLKKLLDILYKIENSIQYYH